jgi:hypothetical protein
VREARLLARIEALSRSLLNQFLRLSTIRRGRGRAAEGGWMRGAGRGRRRDRTDCLDCGVFTGSDGNGEFYMMHDRDGQAVAW